MTPSDETPARILEQRGEALPAQLRVAVVDEVRNLERLLDAYERTGDGRRHRSVRQRAGWSP